MNSYFFLLQNFTFLTSGQMSTTVFWSIYTLLGFPKGQCPKICVAGRKSHTKKHCICASHKAAGLGICPTKRAFTAPDRQASQPGCRPLPTCPNQTRENLLHTDMKGLAIHLFFFCYCYIFLLLIIISCSFSRPSFSPPPMIAQVGCKC